MKIIARSCLAGCLLLVACGTIQAADDIKPLPAPQMTGGKPVMQALKERKACKG